MRGERWKVEGGRWKVRGERSGQRRPGWAGADQVDPVRVGPVQVGPAQVGPAQVGCGVGRRQSRDGMELGTTVRGAPGSVRVRDKREGPYREVPALPINVHADEGTAARLTVG